MGQREPILKFLKANLKTELPKEAKVEKKMKSSLTIKKTEHIILYAPGFFVPGEGVEPSWAFAHSILSAACKPFHHPGKIVTSPFLFLLSVLRI